MVSPSQAANNRTVNRTAFIGETHADYYTRQTDLIGNVETGNIHQELLFGVELLRNTSATVRFSVTLPALDLFNPVYERGEIPFTTRSSDGYDTQISICVCVQDLISIGGHVKILLGGRFDSVEQTRDDRDAEFTEYPRPEFKGNQPNNVPRHNASLWVSYEIKSRDLQGLGFGAGVLFTGERQGDLGNTFELPSDLLTDAAFFYRNNWRFALNIKNLFDVDSYESARDKNAVFPGAPFTVQRTVSL
ncbi:TonB-dependent receptor [Microcoleus sp. N3A4]|uniref:TonB-dependent receptor domain-containing protein n=1 Tax=Microcoleus sp. N3A4 TaxID=3055379 RepID=UPI002FD67B87